MQTEARAGLILQEKNGAHISYISNRKLMRLGAIKLPYPTRCYAILFLSGVQACSHVFNPTHTATY